MAWGDNFILTFTCWNRKVKCSSGGKNPITAHAKIKMDVRIGQFSSATQGDASSQTSQPSAHGRHSNDFGSINLDGSF